MVSINSLRLQLHCAIYRPDSFILMPRYCANLKAIRYESTRLNRIVIVAQEYFMALMAESINRQHSIQLNSSDNRITPDSYQCNLLKFHREASQLSQLRLTKITC